MNKTLISLLLTGALAFGASAPAIADIEHAVQASTQYTDLVTNEVVDKLLNDAVSAFKSPARVSHAGFTAKMPSNMEIVTDRLLQAYQLEPYRTDLLISAANAQIYNKNVDRAIELFEQALFVAPDDIDLHAYLAVWQKFNGNQAESQKHRQILAKLNAGKAQDLTRIFQTIDRVVATPLKEKVDRALLMKMARLSLWVMRLTLMALCTPF